MSQEQTLRVSYYEREIVTYVIRKQDKGRSLFYFAKAALEMAEERKMRFDPGPLEDLWCYIWGGSLYMEKRDLPSPSFKYKNVEDWYKHVCALRENRPEGVPEPPPGKYWCEQYSYNDFSDFSSVAESPEHFEAHRLWDLQVIPARGYFRYISFRKAKDLTAY